MAFSAARIAVIAERIATYRAETAELIAQTGAASSVPSGRPAADDVHIALVEAERALMMAERHLRRSATLAENR